MNLRPLSADFPNLAQLWWQNIGEAVSGTVTPEKAMDNLAEEMDKMMARAERSGVQGACGPKLNKPVAEETWLGYGRSPKAKPDNQKPQGETV